MHTWRGFAVALIAAVALGFPAGARAESPGSTAPPSPPSAPAAPGAPAQATDEILADLPVGAADVTGSDRDLGSTGNEVAVITQEGDAAPSVLKLRTDNPHDADALADHLDALPGVVAAQNQRVRTLDGVAEPLFGSQWNLPMVGAPDAWSRSQGAGAVVAVIDTGVDAGHPDLAGRVLPEIDLLPGVTPTQEETYHGTAVASIVAGAVNNWGLTGVAPEAQILPVAALDPTGVGDSTTVAQAIIASADAGARVINLSLGGPDRDPVLDRACAYAFSRGAVLVAAAGNSRSDGNEVQYPAASPDVLAVASVDSAGSPSTFSNTGRHIDLAAPGQDVLTAVPGGGHDTQSGTSFATPHVAAVAALVASANPALSAPQIASTLRLTAQDDPSGNGRDNRLGHGIVRADRAVNAALSLRGPALPAQPRLRLRQFNAAPEPGHPGVETGFTVMVQARFTDHAWRGYPIQTPVRIQFRPSGSRKYRTVAHVVSNPDGWVSWRGIPPKSGRWRAKVRQPNGRWATSKADALKVRR